MGIPYGHGHVVRSLIAGITKHQTLISSPEVAFTIHTHGYIRRLFVNAGNNCTGLPVKTHGRIGIPDLFYSTTDYLGHIYIAICGYLARDQGQPCGYQSFTGNPGIRVFV